MIPGDDILWQRVVVELPHAIERACALVLRPPADVIASLRTRFELGQQLYKSDFLEWERERFESEQSCELADFILYLAMERVVHPLEGA